MGEKNELPKCPFCNGEPSLWQGGTLANCERHVGDIFPMPLKWWSSRPIEDTLRAERDVALAERDKWKNRYDIATNVAADVMIQRDEANSANREWRQADINGKRIMREQIDTIHKLEKEVAALKAALAFYADPAHWDDRGGWSNCFWNFCKDGVDEGPDIARAALKGGDA